MIVYLITNEMTLEKYVGHTTQSLKNRWYQHCHQAKSSSLPIYEAMRKYGTNHFKIELLCECNTREESGKMESQYIEQLNTLYPNGYNVRSGGVQGGNLHNKTKEIIGNQHRGKTISDKQRAEHSERMSGEGNSMYGKTHSEDTKEKIRQKAVGRKASEETKRKMSEAQKRRNGTA